MAVFLVFFFRDEKKKVRLVMNESIPKKINVVTEHSDWLVFIYLFNNSASFQILTSLNYIKKKITTSG